MDKRTLQQKLNQPYSTENWKEIVHFVFPNVQLFGSLYTIPVDNEKVESFSQLGNVRLNDGKNLALFELTLKSNVNILRNRVELNNLVSQYIDQEQTHGVLSVFEQGKDDYRFTFSAKAMEFDEEEGDFAIKRTDTKRYTYVLGRNESCRTPAERLFSLSEKKETVDINAIQDAFSVEKLSKEFFNGYKDKYLDFVQYITGKRPQKVSNKWEDLEVHAPNAIFKFIFKGNEKAVRDFVKLMLGRLVFIHFVQKKRWLGVPAGKTGWENGDANFLYNAFRQFKHKELFYSHFLEPLFHKALNKLGRPGDLFEVTNTKVPYLNGGLFDKGDLDVSDVNFPAGMFEDLLEFFNRFNFTIDESDLSEREVGIDPEMLGHIFENLLEDNKDKGAFYTPKEIVHYMCRESLKEYLKTQLREQQLWPVDEPLATEMEQALEAFILRKEAGRIIEFDKALATALRDVKICDPAIGSGAFPMGLLNEIYHCMYTLYHASPDIVGDVWGMESWEPDMVKKNIIQNSIYGVDIEKGAVDIARLRFWLSLLIEEEEPNPLPNLDYKIVVGDSLLSKLGDEVIDIDWSLDETSHCLFGAELAKEKAELLRKISSRQKEFFDSESSKEKLAIDIRNLKIDLIINQLMLMIKETDQIEMQQEYLEKMHQRSKDDKSKKNKRHEKASKKLESNYLKTVDLTIKKKNCQKSINNLKKLRESPDEPLHFFDWKLDFPEVLNELVNPNPGFDIVIGNPPYVRQERLGKIFKDLLNERFQKVANGTADLYVYFFAIGLELLIKKGVLSYITLNKYLKTKYGRELRNVLATEYDVDKIIDFFELPVFEASTDASITIIINTKGKKETKYFPVKTLKNLNIFNITSGNGQKVIKDKTEWKFVDKKQEDILGKIYMDTITLKTFVCNKIFYGIKTGYNRAYILEDNVANKILNSESKDILKPYVQPTDIKQWELKSKNKYLLASGYDIDIKRLYPTAYNHLSQFKDQLKNRQDKGKNWWNLRACKYYASFDQPKILYMHTARKHEFYYDLEGRYINNSCYMIITNSQFLFSFLNSELFEWFKKLKFVAYGDAEGSGRAKLDYNKMVTVPIKKVSNQIENVFENLIQHIRNKKSLGIDTASLEQHIDNLIYRLYDLTYDEVKVIDPEFPLSREEYENITLEG